MMAPCSFRCSNIFDGTVEMNSQTPHVIGLITNRSLENDVDTCLRDSSRSGASFFLMLLFLRHVSACFVFKSFLGNQIRHFKHRKTPCSTKKKSLLKNNRVVSRDLSIDSNKLKQLPHHLSF